MKHYGDITKLHGWDLPEVDIITGGSPCQNLSVAGNRKGLLGEESKLFYEQIRIVKEMREHGRIQGRADEFIRPRHMVWENVPGSRSSNSGKDFQIVLTEIVRIAEPDAPYVSLPYKGWPAFGCLYDELGRWSVAWRQHDAQWWGVPQRRKRVCVLADFNGMSAGWILFGAELRRETKGIKTDKAVGHTGTGRGCTLFAECESLSGDLEQGEEEGERTSQGARRGSAIPIEGNGYRPSHRGGGVGEEGDPSFTLNSVEHHAVAEFVDVYNHTVTGNISPTLNASSCNSPTHSGPSIFENLCLNDQGGQ